ncbi:rodlin [Streptomyces sp. CRN 30]|uniref:rodlin n=1 Tax=Streptomyces sp. CRN 30 TaxID=3075613 RepID=UPI002A812E2D|nr:rodlin [Streptomyces sp. CRN 30]
MIKKVIATAVLAASVVGASAVAAPQAMASDEDSGPAAASGNAAMESFGNASTYGNMSPQIALIQGSFNKPCIAISDLPISVIGLQDIPILSSDDNMQCTENSTMTKRDGALAHFLDDVGILAYESENER